ncbi:MULTISPECIES: hypothetical protein [unclassified Rhizobium]|nr:MULTISPECIES: hypothetical protein [unclassified Rhizobium]
MTIETLTGLAILVVEDDYFIADELASSLSRAGAGGWAGRRLE